MTDQTPTVPPVLGLLGGDSSHRGFWGGSIPKARVWSVGVSVVGGLVLTLFFQLIGLLILVVAVVASFLLTQRTHRGSILDRRRKNRRWKHRVQTGTDSYVPYTPEVWEEAQEQLRMAKGRRARFHAARRVASIRLMPDGADGMGWLQSRRGQPGIAWHSPTGETPYLSVVVSLTGMITGVETTHTTNTATLNFGKILARHAAPASLGRQVQSTTRVIPADTALYEFWIRNHVDPAAPDEARASYEEVLRLTSANSMVQHHYVTVSWPLTADFMNIASKHGPGRDGWRALMAAEIEDVYKELRGAGLGQAQVLTARQVAAVLVHLQNPGHPIEQTAGIEPTSFGVPSHDEFSTTVTDGTDVHGNPVQWWHRTAKITADGLSTNPRTPLWLLPLLIGSDLKMRRTFSWHHTLVPAVEAKAASQKDLVRDEASRQSDVNAGRFVNDETDVAATAAAQRLADFRPGTGHEGDYWIGYLTITDTSRDKLAEACRLVESVCHSKSGIERIEWLDSYQAAASGTTWPIGRGTRPLAASTSTRFFRRLAGRSRKDELT
jgi:hypothetical protein